MIAVIGCGYWGKNLIRNFSELGVLSAVCDMQPKLAQGLAQQYGVPSLSVEEVMSSPSITAVVIAAAPGLNAALSLKALKAGKHVFVEKPYTHTQQDAQELEACLQDILKTDPTRIFMVGHLLLYHTAFSAVKELIDSGRIGEVREVRSYRHGLGRVRDEFGVLWELAPHDLSMLLDIIPGQVEDIQVLMSNTLTGNQDTIRVRYHFSKGITAFLSCSWAEPVKQQQLIVQGTHGYIIFDDTKDWSQKVHMIEFNDPMTRQSINQNEYEVRAIPVLGGEVLKKECEHFLMCIREEQRPLSDIHQARRVFDVLLQTQAILNEYSYDKMKIHEDNNPEQVDIEIDKIPLAEEFY